MSGVDFTFTTDPREPDIWVALEQLVDRAPNLAALRAHRLHLAAARIWRGRGWNVPSGLRQTERFLTAITTAAPVVLDRARSAYDGQLMLMKGPEVAACYPHPSDRFFRDLDLLVDDARAAQRALIRAGFIELGDPADYTEAQHLCPLMWPDIPLIVELHRRPNQPPWLRRPNVDEILRAAVPSATGIPGLTAPDTGTHALLLLAHSWTHRPLGQLADLIDLAAILMPEVRPRAAELAQHWGWGGMWQVSLAATDAVLRDDQRPASLNVWGRHLLPVRDRTVLENHIARVAAPACALPARRVPGAVSGVLWHTATRRADERWPDKLRRTRLAVTHALTAKSAHDEALPYYSNGNR